VSLERALYARLTLAPALPIGTRVYPVAAPLAVAFPYAIYARVSAVRARGTTAPSGLTSARVQIDVYSDAYTGARAAADAIRKRLDGWRALVTGSGWSCRVEGTSLLSDQDLHEPEIRPEALFRVSQDYVIHHIEE
jgi:hypothetical protein